MFSIYLFSDIVSDFYKGDLESAPPSPWLKAQRLEPVHVSNCGGLSGSEDRGGGDNSIQFTNFGRVGDKNFKEWRQKLVGGRVGDDKILTFSSHCTR